MRGITKNITVVVCTFVIVLSIAHAIERPGGKVEENDQKAKIEQPTAPQAKPGEEASVPGEANAITLPQDTSEKLMVKRIEIAGNTLIPTEKLIADIPVVFNASNTKLSKASQSQIYDFRTIKEIFTSPAAERPVSMRTVQGFTQYILSEYHRKHYGGIYVYIPADAVSNGKLTNDGLLPVMVVEGTVADVNVQSFDSQQKPTEKSRLRKSLVESWSPVQPGEVINEKKLNDYVDQLNQNPDRYASAVLAQGPTPNTVDVNYKLYEGDPWHFFVQTDNSGVSDTQWTPRYGVINTNALGFDDTFTAVYQARPDSTFQDNYSVFGSYDFPVFSERLRMKLFAGYNEFKGTSAGNLGFLGNGWFAGSRLTYTLFQADKWFFDITGSYSHEVSRVTPSLFPQFLTSDVDMDIVSYGFDIHQRTDMSETSITGERYQNVGGSSQEDFSLARPGAADDFAYDTFSVTRSQYLHADRVDRITGLFRAIYPEDRLIPAKMTNFGGMYTVRGYKEFEIVADGGILASAQYEFDLVRYYEVKNNEEYGKSWLRRLAPAAFVDYGLAHDKDSMPSEINYESMISVGVGLLADIGDHFSGTIYYGIPLKSTQQTDSGEGRINIGVLARW
jgi:hemolysin activation/secretion protein